MSLRDALDSFPAVDLPSIVRELVATTGSSLRRHLLGELAEWGPHEENTAQLFEVQAYHLDWDWTQATIDPDDPAVRQDRLEAKRKGIKPPPRPLIPPTAQRPSGLADQRLNDYLEQVGKHVTPMNTSRFVSRAEFDKAMGLD